MLWVDVVQRDRKGAGLPKPSAPRLPEDGQLQVGVVLGVRRGLWVRLQMVEVSHRQVLGTVEIVDVEPVVRDAEVLVEA